jgi:hypothetical protein
MSTNITPSPSPSPAPQPKKRKAKPSAFADTVREWEVLLGAVSDHAAVLAPIDPHRAALADSLDKARQAKALQDSYKGNKQSTTQSLKAIIVEGKDRAIRLRGAIRAELGPTTEQLTQFGIPPLRRRPPRHKPDVPTPAQQPEVQATKVVKETE